MSQKHLHCNWDWSALATFVTLNASDSFCSISQTCIWWAISSKKVHSLNLGMCRSQGNNTGWTKSMCGEEEGCVAGQVQIFANWFFCQDKEGEFSFCIFMIHIHITVDRSQGKFGRLVFRPTFWWTLWEHTNTWAQHYKGRGAWDHPSHFPLCPGLFHHKICARCLGCCLVSSGQSKSPSYTYRIQMFPCLFSVGSLISAILPSTSSTASPCLSFECSILCFGSGKLRQAQTSSGSSGSSKVQLHLDDREGFVASSVAKLALLRGLQKGTCSCGLQILVVWGGHGLADCTYTSSISLMPSRRTSLACSTLYWRGRRESPNAFLL